MQQDIYFDEMNITHTKSKVIQADDYYPFGLTYGSYRRENSIVNDFSYNGKEQQDELGIGWLDYGARMYSPDIGRFSVVDSRSHNFMMYNPYCYVANNPINYIDYNGDFILPKEFLKKFERIAHYLAYDIQKILENKKIVRALKKHGGFSDAQLKEAFTWGRGPVVMPSDLGPGLEVLGMTGGTKEDPAPLMINIDLFEELERAEGKDKDYWLFITAVTILHETVHYGFIQNELDPSAVVEEGNDFEIDVYGEVIKQSNGSHKKALDQWLRRQANKVRFSGEGIFGIPYIESRRPSQDSEPQKRERDADKEAAKRSGGAH